MGNALIAALLPSAHPSPRGSPNAAHSGSQAPLHGTIHGEANAKAMGRRVRPIVSEQVPRRRGIDEGAPMLGLCDIGADTRSVIAAPILHMIFSGAHAKNLAPIDFNTTCWDVRSSLNGFLSI